MTKAGGLHPFSKDDPLRGQNLKSPWRNLRLGEIFPPLATWIPILFVTSENPRTTMKVFTWEQHCSFFLMLQCVCLMVAGSHWGIRKGKKSERSGAWGAWPENADMSLCAEVLCSRKSGCQAEETTHNEGSRDNNSISQCCQGPKMSTWHVYYQRSSLPCTKHHNNVK